MDEKKIRKTKKRLDKLLGDEELEALKDIIQELKKHSSSFVDLKKYLQNFLDLKKYSKELDEIKKYSKGFSELKKNIEASKLSKEQKVWFRDVLGAVKDLNKELPKEFEVIVKNYPKYPKEIEVSNLKEFPKGIKVSNFPEQEKVVFPKSFKISNLDEIKGTKKVDINEPSWFKQLSKEDIEKLFQKFLKEMKKVGIKVNLDAYRNANRPLSVRLSNGREFYNAIAGIVSGSYGGTTFPFVGPDGKAKEALVDSDGHLQVDIIGPEERLEMHEDSGDSNILYLGTAVQGSLTSAAVWRIKELDMSAVLTIKYADGNENYDNEYDDREALSYS